MSAISIHDNPGGCVKISRSCIVAQALPGVQHARFRSTRQGGEIAPSAQPLIIVRKNGGDLRLLEHELRNENGVWVAGAAPRQITAVTAIPAQQRGAEIAGVWWRDQIGRNVQRSTGLRKTTVCQALSVQLRMSARARIEFRRSLNVARSKLNIERFLLAR